MNNQNTRNKDSLEVAKKQMIKEQKEIFNKERKNDKVFNKIEHFFNEIEKTSYED